MTAADDRPPYWLPVEHNMQRRNQHNNYHLGQRAYMVTLRIEEMAPLLGQLEEDTVPDHVATCHLTALGEAMRKAWLTLPERFHNTTVKDSPDEYVIMPEHFHGIIYVIGYTKEHLGEIVRLFKARVAMYYRYLLVQSAQDTAPTAPNAAVTHPITAVGLAKEWLKAYHALTPAQQAATRQWVEGQLELLYSATRCGTQGSGQASAQGSGQAGTQGSGLVNTQGNAQGSGVGSAVASAPPIRVAASGKHNKVGFLFGTGYTDSLLLDDENLDGHRLYIYENPKSRWMRTHNRQMLKANRRGINTAVTITALEGYLRRECPARDVTASKLATVRSLLLYSATRSCSATRPCSATRCGIEQGAQTTNQGAAQTTNQGAAPTTNQGVGQATNQTERQYIVCHSYGDRGLLERRLLPVVCHRKDAWLFEQQKARCLQEAAGGAVMVSAGISLKEREIMQAVMAAGYPVIKVEDNGFPDLYHPSQAKIDLCAASKLLILTPWQYHYRHKDEAVFVAYCKTMNCIAQALCRTKDTWWKG